MEEAEEMYQTVCDRYGEISPRLQALVDRLGEVLSSRPKSSLSPML